MCAKFHQDLAKRTYCVISIVKMNKEGIPGPIVFISYCTDV